LRRRRNTLQSAPQRQHTTVFISRDQA
jgi:hypothetical protein